MKISWQPIITLAAALVTSSVVIFVNTYYKPNVWYEEGSYYRSGERAITSLRIQNYGHGDAEDIRISVIFPDAVQDVTSGDETIPFRVQSGGAGSKVVSGTITRLVPNESVYLYFAVKNPVGPLPESYNTFVTRHGIVYKGGMASSGKPTSWLALASILLAGLVSTGLGIFLGIRAASETKQLHSNYVDLQLSHLRLQMKYKALLEKNKELPVQEEEATEDP